MAYRERRAPAAVAPILYDIAEARERHRPVGRERVRARRPHAAHARGRYVHVAALFQREGGAYERARSARSLDHDGRAAQTGQYPVTLGESPARRRGSRRIFRCYSAPGGDYPRGQFLVSRRVDGVYAAPEHGEGSAADGEGATKLILCKLTGASDKPAAIKLAKSVINSPLVKCAMFGADANWGRVLCALGYAGVPTDVSKVEVTFSSAAGSLTVCQNGMGVDFSEALAKTVLSEKEITIGITLGDGNASATAYGCDLTYDYVKINGDYRT